MEITADNPKKTQLRAINRLRMVQRESKRVNPAGLYSTPKELSLPSLYQITK